MYHALQVCLRSTLKLVCTGHSETGKSMFGDSRMILFAFLNLIDSSTVQWKHDPEIWTRFLSAAQLVEHFVFYKPDLVLDPTKSVPKGSRSTAS